jgi:Polyketide cyclase / dehydrase and lipid transport
MTDYQGSQPVHAAPDKLFEFLSRIENLPKYFHSMLSAERADGGVVRTLSVVEGRQVEGKAWFRVDSSQRRIEWGSEGPSDYSGWLTVDGSESSTVTVHLSTAREVSGDRVQRGIDETLDNIREIVEKTAEV